VKFADLAAIRVATEQAEVCVFGEVSVWQFSAQRSLQA
jgi:hypothetical protein